MPDEPTHPFPIPAARVLETVADAYGLTVADLTGPGRQRPLGDARRVAYRLLHDDCRLSWAQITGLVGRQPGTSQWLGSMAAGADPAAVELLRARIHVNGQGTLW
jgi:hypothetical protein